MRTSRTLLTLLAGAGFATATILACSDDSPSDADAATCDCPDAEPPLSGRIITRTVQEEIAPDGSAGPAANCPTGAVLLGGGCRLSTPNGSIPLIEAGPTTNGIAYQCVWESSSPMANTGTAHAICLMPAN